MRIDDNFQQTLSLFNDHTSNLHEDKIDVKTLESVIKNLKNLRHQVGIKSKNEHIIYGGKPVL